MSQKTDQDALMWWYSALLGSVRAKEKDMTMRQIAVLMTIYMTPAPHTVRGLAALLGVTKPVITRALDTLEQQGLVKRKKDESDKRSILIQRTVKGAVSLSELSDRILEAHGVSHTIQSDLSAVRPPADGVSREERGREAPAPAGSDA